MEPWSDYLWWNTYINKPHEEGDTNVFKILQTILSPIVLRRTKKSKKKNGELIIQLPQKHYSIESIKMTETEE